MSETILAIDPGNIESGWTLIDTKTMQPLRFGKDDNEDLLGWLWDDSLRADEVRIEMVASYGMAVGKTVFDTCVWVGRFWEASTDFCEYGKPNAELVYRQPIKLHHCGSSKARDSNIRQALIDRFDPEASNGGKGTRANPGWFYGFKADIWAAYALAVYAADELHGLEDLL